MTSVPGLKPGTRYLIVHQNGTQQFPRMSLMSYLGETAHASRDVSAQWSARPAFGTQELPWRWVKWVREVKAGAKILGALVFVNSDARHIMNLAHVFAGPKQEVLMKEGGDSDAARQQQEEKERAAGR